MKKIDLDQFFIINQIKELKIDKDICEEMLEKKNKNNLGTQTILTLIDCLDHSIKKLEDFYKENWGD